MANIIPNLKKMSFFNHDLHRFPEVKMKKYMTIVCDIEDGPIHMVPIDWERVLDKVGLLSLMHMPHFDRTT